jgi:hypothetical protein
MLDALRDLYQGQTAWIVGKGPSLKCLRAEHFGAGPVITINESILIVQDLGLPNPIYSMQKDGDAGIGKAVYPHPDIPVILQRPGYSERNLPDHPLRMWVSPEQDFGLLHTEMSVRLCIGIAKLMGCVKIVFVCCDSLVNGDVRRMDVGTRTIVTANGSAYQYVKPHVFRDVANIPHEFVLPEPETVR